MKRLTGALAALKSGEGLKGQLMRGGVGSMAIKIASTGLNLVLAIVLARLLGSEGFGVYSFIFALITILAIPAQMGLPNLVVRETAKAHANEDWGLIKVLWRWSTLMALSMSAALIVLGALVALVFGDHFTPLQLQTFWWALPLIPLIALGNLRGAALRGLRHVVLGQMPEFVLRPFLIVLFIFCYVIARGQIEMRPSDAMGLHVLGSFVAFIIGALMLIARTPKGQTSNELEASRAWLLSALPLGLLAGADLVNQNLGMILLGIWSENAEVGNFRVALQGSAIISFGLIAINAATEPTFARLKHGKDFEEIQKLATVAATSGLAFAVPPFLLVLFFSDAILLILLGPEFGSASQAFKILAFGQLASAWFGPIVSMMVMAGREKKVVTSLTYSILLNFTLSFVGAIYGGSTGAAIGYVASLLVWKSTLWRYSFYAFKIDTTAFRMTRLFQN